jgi:tripartite-type tricarboxylate transporter receptor subunit TctC
MAALVGKNVDAAIIGSGGYARRPQNVRGLTYFAPKPDQYLTDHLKTVHELGYTQVPNITLIIGIVAPPNTPEAITKKLSDTFVKVAKSPKLKDRFHKIKTDFSIHDYKDFTAFANKRYEETKKMKEYLKK